MQGQLKKSRLISRISKERLGGYGYLDEQQLDSIIVKYLWNCALSESLYESLHWLEISLRNNIHTAASHVWGNSWLTNGQLLAPEQRLVDEALERLIKEGKKTNPEDITAALNFGFWTSLFRKDYEQKLRPILPRMFPYVTPASGRTRKIISDRLNTIRKFRNRVFHFEPIISYKPEIRYGEIKQAMEWMAPELIPFLELNCGFSAEFAKGDTHYVSEVKKILDLME
ncbi:hypothetical protein [Bdellovibrio bacteriovorus]|uniref:hypothetical protein n=1 Tax=Bdellovibrio bacteriovorus TaxID=959 RepID=UPI0035A8978C